MPDTVMSAESSTEQKLIVQGPRQRSPQWGDLMTALAKAQGEVQGAKKDSSNPHFKSSYADLSSVWDAIREPFAKNGLAVMQWPRVVEGGVELETIIAHGEQFISDVLWMPCAQMTAHGIGSAITYARRYALMPVAGVAPEDDDGNGAVDGHKPGAPGTAGAGTQFRPQRRSPGMAQTESLRVDPADRDMVQGDGRSQYEADKAKKAAAPINTPAAAGNAVKRIEWCRAAEATFKAANTKDELSSWWKENAERLEVIEGSLPGEHEKLIVAFDAAMDRVSVRAA